MTMRRACLDTDADVEPDIANMGIGSDPNTVVARVGTGPNAGIANMDTGIDPDAFSIGCTGTQQGQRKN
jgi:hypothetical protein